MSDKTPTVLIILDGFGHREETANNAIFHANTPTLDRLFREAPNRLVSGSGLDVGLPEGQMGNSEVGHMSLGSGRIIYQQITRIDKSIADGDFFENSAYTEAVDKAIANNGAVHIMGLMSAGGVHSHENHICAAIELAAARGCNKVYLHAFLDGRDTPPRSALGSLQKADAVFAKHNCGGTASIIGRYNAMDRDKRWDRVEKAYKLLTQASADYEYNNASDALAAAYARDEDDEFVAASRMIVNNETVTMNDGDSVLFMNFRADRAREITEALTEQSFNGFTREKTPQLASFVMTSEYSAAYDLPCAYPTGQPKNSLGEYLADQGKTQLRIAETEKYAHVTFFFSGGREDEYTGETRVLVQSPDVATYDLQPEMSAPEVTEKLTAAIRSKDYDFIACNYANGDMVGHTGSFDAAVKAVEALDTAVAAVEQAVLDVNGHCLITADHGNCEQMLDGNNEKHTQHTTEMVPLIYIGSHKTLTMPTGLGRLCDIAPSVLALMQLPQPTEMTGESLVSF